MSQARTFNTREFEKGAGLVKKTPITPLYSTTPYYIPTFTCMPLKNYLNYWLANALPLAKRAIESPLRSIHPNPLYCSTRSHGQLCLSWHESDDTYTIPISIEICWKCSKPYFLSLDHLKNTLFYNENFCWNFQPWHLNRWIQHTLTCQLSGKTTWIMIHLLAWAWKKDRWMVSTVELKSSGLYI